MANTLPGTPYVESSDLVANYPAVSESLAERVDLVGILPFATSTARGTALPTPTDGQYTYLQDTNSTEFWNGSAWQSAGIDPGLQIVSPTSIANSGGSASASGGAVTFTGVSSVSLNGVFTSSYTNYCVVFRTTHSGSTNLTYRLRASGSDDTGNIYTFQSLEGSSTTASAATGTQTVAYFGAGSGSTKFAISATIIEPQIAENTFIISQYRNIVPQTGFMNTHINNTTAYDGISIFPSSGTISGIVRVYGYKNS